MVDETTGPDILDRLYALIESRRGGDSDTSYTARLLAEGPERIAQKVGEEAFETAIASISAQPDCAGRLVAESADLIYHLLVLWAACGVTPDQVWAELARREGTSGIAEKAAREGEGGPGHGSEGEGA
jgi:phosphoribosyl-ATP pyrophosphohydrolase